MIGFSIFNIRKRSSVTKGEGYGYRGKALARSLTEPLTVGAIAFMPCPGWDPHKLGFAGSLVLPVIGHKNHIYFGL